MFFSCIKLINYMQFILTKKTEFGITIENEKSNHNDNHPFKTNIVHYWSRNCVPLSVLSRHVWQIQQKSIETDTKPTHMTRPQQCLREQWSQVSSLINRYELRNGELVRWFGVVLNAPLIRVVRNCTFGITWTISIR